MDKLNPTLFSGKTLKAVEIINAALDAGHIQKSYLDAARGLINRDLEDAWDGWRSLYFLSRDPRPADLEAAYYARPELHTLGSTKRAVLKITSDETAKGVALNLIEHVEPLAEAVKHLKGLVKKRQPKTEAEKLAAMQAANPNKVVKTCAWCLRHIAITGQTGMAHHGYTRPGYGYQTASCPGISYPALEYSDAGLRAHIAALDAEITRIGTELARKESTLTTLPHPRIAKKFVGPDEPHAWSLALTIRRNQLESARRDHRANRKYLQNRLDKWEPQS